MTLALVVRLGAAFVFAAPLERAIEEGIGWDGTLSYVPLAENLLAGNGLAVAPGEPSTRHMPLYPALLAAALGLAGSLEAAVLLLQPLLGALSVGVLFLLAHALLGPATGHLAALAAVFFPDLVAYSLLNLSETPHLLATLLASVAMVALLRRPGLGTAIALGLSLGAGILIRESTAPLVALWALLLTPVFHLSARASWRTPAIVVAVAVALLVPWWVRNWHVTGEFVPLTTKGAWNLYQSTLLRPYPVTDHRALEMELDPETAAREADVLLRKSRAKSRSEVDQILLGAALENVRRDPLAQLRHLGMKLVWLWTPNIAPRHAERTGAAWVLWGAAVAHFTALGLGLLGLWTLRKRPEVVVVLIVPLLAFTPFYLVVGGAEPRYHFGAWPALLIGAAALFVQAAHKIRGGIGGSGAD